MMKTAYPLNNEKKAISREIKCYNKSAQESFPGRFYVNTNDFMG